MPWGRLDDSLYDHPKLDLLPVDQRLAGVGLWARAISWCNRFLTDGHIPRNRIEKLDGTTELADLLVSAGLFEATSTGYFIHDFLEFNDSRAHVEERRTKEAERKAAWRANRRPSGTDNGTANGTEANVPPGVPPSVPAGHNPHVPDLSQRPSQRDSRTRESRPGPARPGPAHESLRRESARPGERADIAALRARGWKRITKPQRAVLDEVLERHDVTGPEFAAEVIRHTPDDQDPLAAVMAADRMWQQRQRKRADDDERDWDEAKAEERRRATEFVMP